MMPHSALRLFCMMAGSVAITAVSQGRVLQLTLSFYPVC
jgi:hypothetical protein